MFPGPFPKNSKLVVPKSVAMLIARRDQQEPHPTRFFATDAVRFAHHILRLMYAQTFRSFWRGVRGGLFCKKGLPEFLPLFPAPLLLFPFLHSYRFAGAFFCADAASFAVFDIYFERKIPCNQPVWAIEPAEQASIFLRALLMIDFWRLGSPVSRPPCFTLSGDRLRNNYLSIYLRSHV